MSGKNPQTAYFARRHWVLPTGKKMTLAELVTETMRMFPPTRNSFEDLAIQMYNYFFDVALTESFVGVFGMIRLKRIPNPDDIRRKCAEIQAGGMYLPSDSTVRAQRKRTEADWVKWYHRATQEGIPL